MILFRVYKMFGVEAYETYGMTETITHIAVKKLNNFENQKEMLYEPFKVLPDVLIETDREKMSCNKRT